MGRRVCPSTRSFTPRPPWVNIVGHDAVPRAPRSSRSPRRSPFRGLAVPDAPPAHDRRRVRRRRDSSAEEAVASRRGSRSMLARPARSRRRRRDSRSPRPRDRHRRRPRARQPRLSDAVERHARRARRERRAMGRRPCDGLVDAAAPARDRPREHAGDDRRDRASSASSRRSGCRTDGSRRSSSRCVVGEVVLVNSVKQLLDRVRPTFNPIAETLGPSFPSGHSATAAALYAAVALVLARRRSARGRGRCSRGVRSAIAVGVACSRVHARRPLALGRRRRPRLRLGLVLALRDRFRRPVPHLRRAGREGGTSAVAEHAARRRPARPGASTATQTS